MDHSLFVNKSLSRFVSKSIFDDNARIFHVFEMWIGMNEFYHRILALLEQQRERPKKFRPERGFEP